MDGKFTSLRIARLPEPGPLTADTYDLVDGPMPVCGEGECLLRLIYLSVDAGSRAMLDDRSDYVLKRGIGDSPTGSGAVGQVLVSHHPDYAPGDFVRIRYASWQSHLVVAPARMHGLAKIDLDEVPLDAHLGLLGLAGFTAYVGIFGLFEIRPGETVVISAAAGAVGSIAGQFAKIAGARVIGIAGGQEKCAFVRDELGFDDCLDYRGDLAQQLAKACPDGVDVYFENVGGEIQRIVFEHMRDFGRIAMCGQVAQYSGQGEPDGPNLMTVVLKRLNLRGFLAADDFSEFPTFIERTSRWYAEGRLKHHSSIVTGLENAYEAVNNLTTGRSRGKQLIQVSAQH